MMEKKIVYSLLKPRPIYVAVMRRVGSKSGVFQRDVGAHAAHSPVWNTPRMETRIVYHRMRVAMRVAMRAARWIVGP
jgi:hypothetical protein